MAEDIEIVEITRDGRVTVEGEGDAQEILTMAGVPVPFPSTEGLGDF